MTARADLLPRIARGRSSSGLAAYRIAARLASPLAPLFLRARAWRGREDGARLGERLGIASRPRPTGPLVWLHGASIGEVLSLLPLMDELRACGFSSLVTTGTRAGADVLATRLPPDVVHQYAPLDLPGAVLAFLDHWRPNALLLAESELWPNLLAACSDRPLPVAVVSGRISARSSARWHRAPRAAREVFGGIDLCLAQTETVARCFCELGAPRVIVAGSLKYDGAPPPAEPAELARLQVAVGTRPVLLAASSHEDDEALVLRTHAALRARWPDLLTIIAPRDITRRPNIEKRARRCDLSMSLRTRDRVPAGDAAVFIADTFGETGLWLRLATVAVIGKTFGTGGGQTPIEAARCGATIVHGPSVQAFAEVFAALDESGGALAVDATSLSETVASLIGDASRRDKMQRAARTTIDGLAGGTARTLAALRPLLDAARARPAG